MIDLYHNAKLAFFLIRGKASLYFHFPVLCLVILADALSAFFQSKRYVPDVIQ